MVRSSIAEFTSEAIVRRDDIKFASVVVEDQDQALRFYTEVLDFVKSQDLPNTAG
jgi:hypothetical protein